MGVRILEDMGPEVCCLYCSTSETAFGPLIYELPQHDMDCYAVASAFIKFLPKDARSYSVQELQERYSAFLELTKDPRWSNKCAWCTAPYDGCWENDECCSVECAHSLKQERFEDALCAYADDRRDRMKNEGF